MLFFVLSACIVNTELYESRRAALTDNDGDGFSEVSGDCDDTNQAINPDAQELCDDIDNDCDGETDEDDATDAAVWHIDEDSDGYGATTQTLTACAAPPGWSASADDCDDTDGSISPGADEVWYDGIDQDCAGDDDYDADRDSDPATAYGGGDCDDADPTRSSVAQEGWTDNGVDNNCDGQIYDDLALDIEDFATIITGTEENGTLGASLLYLEAEWTGGEPMVLASAPLTGDNQGETYGWAATSLLDGPTVSDPDWQFSGRNGQALSGIGLAWAGTAEAPVTLLAEPGPEDGAVLGWTAPLLDTSPAEPDFEIVSASGSAGQLGLYMKSGIDRDGDGIYEVMIPASNESSSAPGGGAVYFFDDLAASSGVISTDDADAVVACAATSAQLTATPVGDFDGDGLDDIGFTLNLPNQLTIPGGILVTDTIEGTIEDVQLFAEVSFFGGGFTFSSVQDTDSDGWADIHVASGNIYPYEAPLSGSLYPDSDAPTRYEMTPSEGDYASAVWAGLPDYTSRRWLMSASPDMDNIAGRVRLHQLSETADVYLADAPLQLRGSEPGDRFGMSVLLADLGAGYSDALVIGAGGVDSGAQEGGAVYIIPGPR